MSDHDDHPLDELWEEHGQIFREFDDLTLARWMAQTLSQLQGRGWRLSHPLVAAYRLCAQTGHERQVWLKRLVSAPASFLEAGCCRAPAVPLLTREVLDLGLVCLHCNQTLVPFDELPADLHPLFRSWAEEYAPVHEVAHWDERRQQTTADYDGAFEDAAEQAETLLAFAAHQLVPKLLDAYPLVIWEDHDECLEVRPEDVRL